MPKPPSGASLHTELNRISQAVDRLLKSRLASHREGVRNGAVSATTWDREICAQVAYDQAMLAMSEAIRKMEEAGQ